MRVCLKPQHNALFEIRARYQWAETIPASMQAKYGEYAGATEISALQKVGAPALREMRRDDRGIYHADDLLTFAALLGELSSIIAAQYNSGLYASARLEIVPLGYQR